MLFWNSWNQESAGRVYFNISRMKNPLTRQTCRVFNRSRANLNGPIRNTFIVFLLKPIRDNLAPGFPRALDLSPLHAQKSSGSRLATGWTKTDQNSENVQNRDTVEISAQTSTGSEISYLEIGIWTNRDITKFRLGTGIWYFRNLNKILWFNSHYTVLAPHMYI